MKYLFLVRQEFGKEPALDSFYQIQSPSNMTLEQVKLMRVLKPNWSTAEIKEDASTIKGLELRLRFNASIYRHICLVTTEFELLADDLEQFIIAKHQDNTLTTFLTKAGIK